ncbi:uncharacterized protein LOC143258755 [Megalopta genalis]|uniref:uncharacterized protein LOC143258755 n=1 Tax=Megalopta genalis TaxID=115081 RepID=UPI003FD38C80
MGNATTKNHYSKSSLVVGGASRRPRWEGSGLPAPPGKPILIPGADESQPEVVAIRWERSPSNGGSAIVGYLVEHRRLGSQHWVRSAPGLCTFPELTLSGLEPGWRYQFRIRAQNAVGLSRPSEISDPLTVTLQRSAASPPGFDLELKDTTVLENDQAEFVVRYTGSPLPKISWFKDGFEIFSSRRTRIITDSGRSVLLIHQTALNDEGEIKCTATNRAGHTSTKARLMLEAPPKIRLPRQYEDGLLFEQDETIRLKVTMAGRPPPSVMWYHDGELISDDSRHVFETMDIEAILKIPDAKRIDRGEYTVKAINKLGEDISSFLVTVTDRPAAPGKAMVTMTLGRSVTLSWQEPEDDGGCKIGTYIVEYYRIGWDVWLKATTSRQTKATLSELIEGSEYKFRVKAENPYGMSEPSEESDVIFIPDLKRGIVTPSMGGKSQSHREIRSREKREVSFAMPTQRTRSLTREEGRGRDEEDEGRFGPNSRSVSAQRLSRPSRADSRVTFAMDTLDKSEPPVPPARSRDHSNTKHDSRSEIYTDRSSIGANVTNTEITNQVKDTVATVTSPVAVPASPPPEEESARRSTYRESRSRSTSVSRERSMSPLSMQQIPEEESPAASTPPLRHSVSLTLRKQQAIVDEPEPPPFAKSHSLDDKPGSPTTPREDDESALHGSSEFMLVLYPDDQDKKLLDVVVGSSKTSEGRQAGADEGDEMDDLIPPPMSLSLPELFSQEHQVVETLREAVSSTELLHERAMERFYRAVAAEEASEQAKRRTRVERRTGELASVAEGGGTGGDAEAQDPRRSTVLRRLSNPGVTAQNLISWQAKKNRRRSSEGQPEVLKSPSRLTAPTVLPDIEARSDPNLPSDADPSAGVWGLDKEAEAATRLRRWHDANVPLVPEGEEEEEDKAARSMPWQAEASGGGSRSQGVVSAIEPATPAVQPEPREQEEQEDDEEEEEESIETSEESSEEGSSEDSEDLKLLKARILARQVLEEEDTYHPRGRPVQHMDLEPLAIHAHKIPTLDVTPPTPTSPGPASPTNLVPKSILKKPKEEQPIPVNSFGRSIPPEKPVRKVPPVQSVHPVVTRDEEVNEPQTMKPPALSESDTDSMMSAGEAAKTRRIQAKMRSAASEEEIDEEDVEARMAVVNHYTEIVREHSSRYSYRGSEERRFSDGLAGSRRSSYSEEQGNLGRDRGENVVTKKQDVRETEKQRAAVRRESKVDGARQEELRKPRRSAGSRGTTPARDTKSGKELVRDSVRDSAKDARASRASSRTQSPASRSRNASSERGGGSSRSSSKTRARGASQDRRPVSRTGSEDQRLVKERSVDDEARRSRKPSHSRSSSRDRSRSRKETPVKAKMERLQKALESKKYRGSRRGSGVERDLVQGRPNGEQLAIEAQKNVRFTVGYVTDLILLMAAVYVYLFKKETLAIPFIALLLYRWIQHEIRGRVSRGWWWSERKQ